MPLLVGVQGEVLEHAVHLGHVVGGGTRLDGTQIMDCGCDGRVHCARIVEQAPNTDWSSCFSSSEASGDVSTVALWVMGLWQLGGV